MREELPDDDGVVQRSDQPQPTPTIRARENVNPERPVHEGGPTPGARTALRLYTLGPRSQQRQAAGSGATRPCPTTRSRQRARAASRPWQINRALPGFVWVEIETSAVEEDGGLEVLGVAEAAGGLFHPLDDGVHALQAGVRDAVAQVGEQVRQVALDELAHRGHRL